MRHLLDWLVGQVWPNVFASILWAVPAFVWHHRRIKRHHTAELDKLRKHLLGAISEQRQAGDR